MQESPADSVELIQLRRVARDLVSMSTLAAAWNSLPSEGVIKSLVQVLTSTLDLQMSYVRIDGAAPLEAIRTNAPGAAESFLAHARDAAAGAGGGGGLHTYVLRMGIGNEIGVIVCGANRPDFPNEHERLVIGVAANQGVVVLQRRLAEEVLARSNMRFLDLADAAPAMLWVTTPDGHCSFLSRGWYSFTGQSGQEGEGFGWTEMIHPDDRDAARKAFLDANSARKEFSIEHRLLHADGSYRWVIDTGRPRFAPDGSFLGFVGNVLDVTDRKVADQSLHDLRRLLSQVFDALPVGIAVANREGQVLLSNQGMGRYLPTNILPSLDDARRHRWRAHYPDGRPLDTTDFAAQRAMKGEAVVPGIEVLYTPDDGEDIWTLVAAIPLVDGRGERDGQVCIVTDIDTFKRTEAALRQSEVKQRALLDELTAAHNNLTQFLAVLAHELRNPIAPIMTSLELLRMRADSPDTVASVRGVIERQARQLLHLIDDLLDLARVNSGKINVKKSVIDLRGIVANAVETSQPQIDKGRHVLDIRLDAAALPVHVDAARIAQVISNLLTNAAKYTPPGGRIDVSVMRDGEHAIISVRDNGVGIPPDALESVFGMFTQVGRNMQHAQGGLGIGLSLVRQLVAMHGGTVHAESAGPDSGSTFVVRLPLAGTGDSVSSRADF